MKNLKGKTALVTGASGGIGLEIAHELAKSGCHLILVSRSAEKLNALASELVQKFQIKTEVIAVDLSQSGSSSEIFREILKKNLQVDILVNNAGSGLMGIATEMNLNNVVDMLNLNMMALTELSLLFGGEMKKRREGSILNIGSMVALMPVPFFTAYSASKSYVRTFSFALRSELKPFGIKVSCLLPGYVKTNFDQAAGATHPEYTKLSSSMGATANYVARRALKLIQTGKAEKVAGFLNKFGAFLIHWFPKTWIASLIYGNLKKKI